jgi:hypothetical protein
MNVEKYSDYENLKATITSEYQKQLDNVEYLSYLGSMINK